MSFPPFGVILVICSIPSVSFTDISVHTTDAHAVLCEDVAEAREIFTASDVRHVGDTLSLGKAKIKVMERLRHICECNLWISLFLRCMFRSI